MNEKQVLDYLLKHPNFIKKYSKDLTTVLPSNKKVISFDEVKMKTEQKKVDTMAKHMENIFNNVTFNQELTSKLLGLNLDLMACNTIKQTLDVLFNHLTNQFSLPIFAFRFLAESQNNKAKIPKQYLLTDKSLTTIKKISKPLCGQNCVHPDVYKWLDKNQVAESFLHLPIIYGKTHIALLLIGHPDSHHYTKDQPTDYVELLANSIATTLARIMGIRSQ